MEGLQRGLLLPPVDGWPQLVIPASPSFQLLSPLTVLSPSMMAPPTAAPFPGPAFPPEDPGPDLESRWLFLSANILPVGE